MATIDDVLAYVNANPQTYGKWLPKKPELWDVVKEQPGQYASEKIYNYLNPGAWERAQRCKMCSKGPMKFENGAYRVYCSNACRGKDNLPNAGLEYFKTDEAKQKRKDALEARYGTSSMIDVHREKAKATMLERYGVEYPGQSKELMARVDAKARTEAAIASGKQNRVASDQFRNMVEAIEQHACREIYEYVKSLAPSAIVNDRQLLKLYEIDIYIPEKKLGIEVDGIYWHQQEQYPKPKLDICYELGVQLLHITDMSWEKHRDAWKSMIASKLGVTTRVHGRLCEVVKLTPKQSREFFNANHIQGYAPGQAYGLMKGGMLLAAMAFCKPRFTKHAVWELLRFANVLDTTVVGGASKLLAAFMREHEGSIVSYAKREYSQGNLYEQLGFVLKSQGVPSYYYIDRKGCIISRYQAQKQNLPQLLGEKYNPALTELTNMQSAGFMLVHDRGSMTWLKDA